MINNILFGTSELAFLLKEAINSVIKINKNIDFTPLEKKPRHLCWREKSNNVGLGLKLCPNFLTWFTILFIISPERNKT